MSLPADLAQISHLELVGVAVAGVEAVTAGGLPDQVEERHRSREDDPGRREVAEQSFFSDVLDDVRRPDVDDPVEGHREPVQRAPDDDEVAQVEQHRTVGLKQREVIPGVGEHKWVLCK